MIQRNVVPGRASGIMLLCSFCGRARNNAGKWEKIDGFIEKYPYPTLSHGICPECASIQFPNEYAAICREKKRGVKYQY
jgi:hypothetical protein